MHNPTQIKTLLFSFMPNNNNNSDFFSQVYQVVALIPKSRATSYGAIAKYLGSARSSRMVGWAMNASHTAAPGLPAHRVVNRNGVLTGKHFFVGESMEERLRREGIRIENDQILDWDKVFWDPGKELGLD